LISDALRYYKMIGELEAVA